MMNRRSFLQSGLCASAIAAVSPFSASAIAEYKKYEKRIPIGLELYSLRDVMNHDTFPKYIKEVAEWGYECVEFAGYHGYSGAEMKKMLDDVGIKAVSTHTGFNTIQGDELKKTAEFAAEVGFKYLLVPGGLEGRMRESLDSNKKVAEEMSACAEEAAKYGMFVGFHGHTGDYGFIKGTEISAWVEFFNNCDPRVVAEVDLGWCNNAMRTGVAKLSPAETLAALPGRGKVLHVKSNGDVNGCVVGDEDDQVDWAPILQAAHEKAGTEYFVVEQEQWKKTSCDSARECLENLKKMGW